MSLSTGHDEKIRLIEEITLSLEDVVNSMKRLNMNMEQLIDVSNDTARVAEVWNAFFSKLSQPAPSSS